MTVEIREEQLELLTYAWGPPDPNPPFQREGTWSIYPYPLLDDIREEARPSSYRSLVVENEYLRVVVLPELGGRIFSAAFKPTGQELFYRNNVVKPGLIALRGAWISGGVEWNFPRGHTVTTVSPVDACMVQESDGAATIWVGNIEQVYRMFWAVGIRLRPGSCAIETEIHLTNRTGLPHPYCFWANAAVAARDDMRLIYPGSRVRTWGGTYDWPVHEGRDLARYTAFSHSNDVFLLDSLEDFFGVFYEEQDFGLVHVADVHQVSGKKFFTWGTAEHGKVWSAALSDSDGPYCEVQSGRFADQQTWRMMPPHQGEGWLEWWYPVRGAGGLAWANKEAAVHMQRRGASVECAAMVTRPQSGVRALVLAGGRVLRELAADLAPDRPLRAVALVSANAGPATLVLRDADGRELIRYTEAQRPRTITLCEEPKEGDSTVGELLRKAVRAEERAEQDTAWELYERVLILDPACDEAALALGRLAIECKPKQAIARLQGVAVARPESAEAAYYLGLALARAGRASEAEIEFWRAAHSPEFAHAAQVQLGLMAMKRGEWLAAAVRLNDSLRVGAADARTWALLAAANRKIGRLAEARQYLGFAQSKLPFDHLVWAEVHFCVSALKRPRLAARALRELADLMPPQPDAWLELSLDYASAGLWEEVTQLLTWAAERVEAVGQSPLVHYLLGCSRSRLGLHDAATAARISASSLSPELAFAHHWEMENVLREALEHNPGDARPHYYLGELLYSQGRKEEALEEWQAAVEGGDDLAVLRRNLAMAYQQVKGDPAKAEEELRKAVALNPADPRLYLELNEVLGRRAAAPQVRLAALDAAPEVVLRRGSIAAQQAVCCLELEQWDRAIELLATHTFHRWELEFRMRTIYVDAYLGRGIARFDSGEIAAARADFETALEYPMNLRIGRPPQPADARAHWCAAAACEAQGDMTAARAHWVAAAAEDYHHPGKELALYRALSLSKLGRTEEAEALLYEAVALARQCAEMAPDDACAQFSLGLALKAGDRQPEAQAALRRARDLDPRMRRAERLLKASVIL